MTSPQEVESNGKPTILCLIGDGAYTKSSWQGQKCSRKAQALATIIEHNTIDFIWRWHASSYNLRMSDEEAGNYHTGIPYTLIRKDHTKLKDGSIRDLRTRNRETKNALPTP